MTALPKIILVDIGNTAIKVKLNDYNSSLIQSYLYHNVVLQRHIYQILFNYLQDGYQLWISSVVQKTEKLGILSIFQPKNKHEQPSALHATYPIFWFDNNQSHEEKQRLLAPIDSNYRGLGMDRIFALKGAVSIYQNQQFQQNQSAQQSSLLVNNVNMVIIHAGTALVADYLEFTVEQKIKHIGGAIAPNIALQMFALAKQTDGLMLPERVDELLPCLHNNNTENAIQQGVLMMQLGWVDYILKQVKPDEIWLTGNNTRSLFLHLQHQQSGQKLAKVRCFDNLVLTGLAATAQFLNFP
jgi:pantothenate kinase type III